MGEVCHTLWGEGRGGRARGGERQVAAPHTSAGAVFIMGEGEKCTEWGGCAQPCGPSAATNRFPSSPLSSSPFRTPGRLSAGALRPGQTPAGCRMRRTSRACRRNRSARWRSTYGASTPTNPAASASCCCGCPPCAPFPPPSSSSSSSSAW